MNAPRRTIGPKGAQLILELGRRRRTTVSLDSEADRALLDGITRRPKQLLHDMKESGVLISIGRSTYVVASWAGSLLEQAIPVPAAIDAYASTRGRYYLAFLTALIEHHLTDEDSWPVHLAVEDGFQVPARSVDIAGRPLRFARLSGADRMVGRERIWTSGKEGYWRSDLERTLVDTQLKPLACGGFELITEAWRRAFHDEADRPVDLERLAAHAAAISNSTARRVGFMLASFGRGEEAVELLGHQRGRTNTVYLDSSKEFGVEGPRDPVWGLRLNVPEARFRGWVRA